MEQDEAPSPEAIEAQLEGFVSRCSLKALEVSEVMEHNQPNPSFAFFSLVIASTYPHTTTNVCIDASWRLCLHPSSSLF